MVGILVNEIEWYEIGTEQFLYSFFSTIHIRLENKVWGSKYPNVMVELYNGHLRDNKIKKKIIKELQIIKKELSNYDPEEVIWDDSDLTLLPPWNDNISKSITSLSNYFVTSGGEDLIDLLIETITKGLNSGAKIDLIELNAKW